MKQALALAIAITVLVLGFAAWASNTLARSRECNDLGGLYSVAADLCLRKDGAILLRGDEAP